MPCSICGQTGHYRTTCPSRNASLVTHDETPPALPKSSLQDVVAAAKAFCAQRTQLSASSSAFSSARVVGAAPRAMVSSTYGIHGASRLLDTDITTYWQSNDSGSRRPHWIELTSAQDGVPLGELSWYIKDFGSYTPQDILVKKRVGADARWDAGKSITLPSSPEGWRTLLSAAEMGTADRVRVEVLSNHQHGIDSKVVGVRTEGSCGLAGFAILASLESACASGHSCGVDKALLKRASKMVRPLQLASAMQAIDLAWTGREPEPLEIAISRAREVKVSPERITEAEGRLAVLRVQAADKAKALEALAAASSVPALTSAFQLAHAAGEGVFLDDELAKHHQRLVDLVERSLADAGSDVTTLQAAVAAALEASAAIALPSTASATLETLHARLVKELQAAKSSPRAISNLVASPLCASPSLRLSSPLLASPRLSAPLQHAPTRCTGSKSRGSSWRRSGGRSASRQAAPPTSSSFLASSPAQSPSSRCATRSPPPTGTLTSVMPSSVGWPMVARRPVSGAGARPLALA